MVETLKVIWPAIFYLAVIYPYIVFGAIRSLPEEHYETNYAWWKGGPIKTLLARIFWMDKKGIRRRAVHNLIAGGISWIICILWIWAVAGRRP